jgi:hypothetical protein
MDNSSYTPIIRELAARIYCELIRGSMAVGDSSTKMTSSADNLAKLSFRLAEAFQAVDDELNPTKKPRNVGFQLQDADVSSWSK